MQVLINAYIYTDIRTFGNKPTSRVSENLKTLNTMQTSTKDYRKRQLEIGFSNSAILIACNTLNGSLSILMWE